MFTNNWWVDVCPFSESVLLYFLSSIYILYYRILCQRFYLINLQFLQVQECPSSRFVRFWWSHERWKVFFLCQLSSNTYPCFLKTIENKILFRVHLYPHVRIKLIFVKTCKNETKLIKLQRYVYTKHVLKICTRHWWHVFLWIDLLSLMLSVSLK